MQRSPALPGLCCPARWRRLLHAGIRNSRYVLIENARHLTPLEVPDRIADELSLLMKGNNVV
jgi:pimeloyl-ACP methyl ester carboxylesterase